MVTKVYFLVLYFVMQIYDVFGNESTTDMSGSVRTKRSVVNLYKMVKCTTHCDPIFYKGYGCYCGFSGSGRPVDGIDRCCQKHDRCYGRASKCGPFHHYFASYKWKCNRGYPSCHPTKGLIGGRNSCGAQVCECDRVFAKCIQKYRCPTRVAVCKSDPWRYTQNILIRG